MFVGCFAFISTRVFGIAIQNVQDDYSKIVESSESMSSRQGFAIFEPFDFQVRIFNGSQFCFQMATLSFSNVKLFVETRYKFGRSNIFGSGWSYISTFWKILKKNYYQACDFSLLAKFIYSINKLQWHAGHYATILLWNVKSNWSQNFHFLWNT